MIFYSRVSDDAGAPLAATALYDRLCVIFNESVTNLRNYEREIPLMLSNKVTDLFDNTSVAKQSVKIQPKYNSLLWTKLNTASGINESKLVHDSFGHESFTEPILLNLIESV